jgi:hypothetical protein
MKEEREVKWHGIKWQMVRSICRVTRYTNIHIRYKVVVSSKALVMKAPVITALLYIRRGARSKSGLLLPCVCYSCENLKVLLPSVFKTNGPPWLISLYVVILFKTTMFIVTKVEVVWFCLMLKFCVWYCIEYHPKLKEATYNVSFMPRLLCQT